MIYVWHCDHCGWHHETESLAGHNWIGSDPYAHCRRVPRESSYARAEIPALFDLPGECQPVVDTEINGAGDPV